jgi:hypothetical protein
MRKGSHIPETKKSLNDVERKLLSYLLDPLDQECSFTATSLQIDEMLKNTGLVKDKKWTHHTTCQTLSNLVGMDLVEESTGYLEQVGDEMIMNNQTPVYCIELDSTIHSRAVYARDRDNSSGISLFNIIRGDEEYGEGLWPNRPTDIIQYEGKVLLVGGIPQVMYQCHKDDLKDMVGQTVKITIQS